MHNNVVSVQCPNVTRVLCRPGDLPDHPGEPRPYLYPHHAHHQPPQRKSSVIVRNNRNISLPSSSPAPAPGLVSPCGPPPPRLPASPDSEAGAGVGAGAGRHRAQHDWLKQLQSLRKIIVKSQNRLLIEFILT